MMKRTVAGMILALLMLTGTGCVEVYQRVKMNHDGSGQLTERIRILPRAVRLMEGQKARGGSEDAFALLSDAALKQRTEAFGAVTLKSRNVRTLEDGSRELETVFAFQDVNKIRLWMAPTFACSDPKRQGRLGMGYQRIVPSSGRDPVYYKRDRLGIDVRSARPPTQTKFSSPAVLQDYREIAPIFQDMLADFRLEVQIEAPDGVEAFEDPSMVRGIPVEGNVVTPYRVYGENVVLNSELVRSFLMGEVAGRVDAYGGDWRRTERALPNTYTPAGADYYGMAVDFLKASRVPKPE